MVDCRDAHLVYRIWHLIRGNTSVSILLTLFFQNRFDELQDGVISYGPCQFPTLGFVVDRYKRIQARLESGAGGGGGEGGMGGVARR